MVSASVGFQCPECAREGAKQQRLVDVFRQQPSVATYVLIGLNVAVFVLGAVAGNRLGGDHYADFESRFALWAGLTEGGQVVGVANGEWWRIITSGFLHAGLLHLGFNMFALYNLGGVMERMIGTLRFVAIYVASLIGGSLLAMATSSPMSSGVGASGAVFGLFGAFVFVQLSRGQNPMQGGIGSTIAINLAFTFLIPGISRGAHVGGLLVGALCGWILIGSNRLEARSRAGQATARTVAVAALSLAMMAAAVWVANRVVVDGAFLNWN
ncbi:MAG: rhomboid family intramembrane serine protease [Actinobacteria bacterium]|jgi:membrane associated rhomboid family serine protease|nr:rhomboid family intramembrane serine protease [Actinomycetota bacterium]